MEDREDQFTVVNTQVPQGPLPSRERREDAWEFVRQYLPRDEQGMSYEEWRDATVRELAETLRRQGAPEAKAFDLAFERLDRLTPQQMYDTLLAPGSRDFCITYTVPEGLQERCKPIFVDDDGPSEESLPTFLCFLSAVIGEPLPDCWR